MAGPGKQFRFLFSLSAIPELRALRLFLCRANPASKACFFSMQIFQVFLQILFLQCRNFLLLLRGFSIESSQSARVQPLLAVSAALHFSSLQALVQTRFSAQRELFPENPQAGFSGLFLQTVLRA